MTDRAFGSWSWPLTHQSESFITNGTVTYAGPNGDTVTVASHFACLHTRSMQPAYYDVSDNLRVQVNVENLTDDALLPEQPRHPSGERRRAVQCALCDFRTVLITPVWI